MLRVIKIFYPMAIDVYRVRNFLKNVKVSFIFDFTRVRYCADVSIFVIFDWKKKRSSSRIVLHDRSFYLSKINLNQGILLNFLYCTRIFESRRKLTRISSAESVTQIWRNKEIIVIRKKKEKGGKRRPKHFLVAKNREEGWSTPGWWLHERRRVDRAPLRLFQLSIGHRRKLHVAFPCVTMHAGYNRITLLLCHQEDHYAQPGARRRSERNCIV